MTFQKLLPAFVAILLQTSSLSAQTPFFSVAIDTTQANPAQLACVHIKSVGFNDIVSFQYCIEWDNSIIAYEQVENNILPNDPLLSNFFCYNVENCAAIGWDSPTGIGVTIPDGTTLFDLCFTVIGDPGTGTDLTHGYCFPPGNGFSEAYNENSQDIWNLALFVNGRIDVVEGNLLSDINPQSTLQTLHLQPNPTTSDATLYLESALPGEGKVLITNASGQLIWTQTIQYQAGKNAMTILAEVLNHVGLYQVSLETESGVVTRMLSVH